MDGIRTTITPFDWQDIRRPKAGDSVERMRETAGQFESLLMGMMLKSMRESSGGGWLGTGEEQSLSSISDLAEQQVAQALAASGGFGLADMVVQGLERAKRASEAESLNTRGAAGK